jgi:hypothetical protein
MCGEARPTDTWRIGKMMVVRRGSRLPAVCLVSGEPTERRERMVFRWRGRYLIYLLVFLSCLPPTFFVALPLLVISILFRVIRRAEIEVGLTPASSRLLKVRKRLWLLPPLFVVGGIVAIYLRSQWEMQDLQHRGGDPFVNRDVAQLFFVAVGAMIAFVGLPLSVITISRWIQNSFGLSVCGSDEDYYFLEGVHPAVLAKLPEWPPKEMRGNRQLPTVE